MEIEADRGEHIKRLELLIQYTRNQWGKSRLYCGEVFVILTKALGLALSPSTLLCLKLYYII